MRTELQRLKRDTDSGGRAIPMEPPHAARPRSIRDASRFVSASLASTPAVPCGVTQRHGQRQRASAPQPQRPFSASGSTDRRRYPLSRVVAALGPAAGVSLCLSSRSYFSHRAPKLSEKDSIVLAEFTNTTGDTVFDGTLRQGLASQLAQSPFLNILSDEQIQQTLRYISRPPPRASPTIWPAKYASARRALRCSTARSHKSAAPTI